MVPVPAAKRRPLVMAASGPAAGVSASARMARELGRSRVLTFDMGGTTTDVCLIVDGQAEMTDTRMIGGRPAPADARGAFHRRRRRFGGEASAPAG